MSTEPLPPPRRSRVTTTVLALAALLLTFVAGVVVGAAADRILQIRGGPMVPRHAGTMMLNRLDRHLDLTDGQREQIGRILERRHARMNALWSGVRPQVEKELAATNDEITRLLTPEQREKFEKMKLRMHGPRHGRRSVGGP